MSTPTCTTCGAVLTLKDCFCDGVICVNGHTVRDRQCDGICSKCSGMTGYLVANRRWIVSEEVADCDA